MRRDRCSPRNSRPAWRGAVSCGPTSEAGQQQPERSIADKNIAITSDRLDAALFQEGNDLAAQERPGRRGQRAGQMIPGEDPRARIPGNVLGEGRLFDRQKRADFIAAGADDADGCAQEERHKAGRAGEHGSAQGHEQRAGQEHALAADAVGDHGDPE